MLLAISSRLSNRHVKLNVFETELLVSPPQPVFADCSGQNFGFSFESSSLIRHIQFPSLSLSYCALSHYMSEINFAFVWPVLSQQAECSFENVSPVTELFR